MADIDDIFDGLEVLHKKIEKAIKNIDHNNSVNFKFKKNMNRLSDLFSYIYKIIKIVGVEKLNFSIDFIDYEKTIEINKKINDLMGLSDVEIINYMNSESFFLIENSYCDVYQLVCSHYFMLIIDVQVEKINKISKNIDEIKPNVVSMGDKMAGISSIIARVEKSEETLYLINSKLEELTVLELKTGNLEVSASQLVETLKEHEETARGILDKADKAFTAAIQQGLAKAFSDQARAQIWSMRIWIVALLAALGAGGWAGFSHFPEVKDILLTSTASEGRLAMLLLMYALPLTGVIWFAWLATKQIGQRFRLAQDYTFKAAAASAYEGFRRQASEIDKAHGGNDLERGLMLSALSRFDEQPLRLIENATHGSPWHDLLGKMMETTGKAADTVSDATGKTAGALGKAVDAVKEIKAKVGDAGAGDKP
ncbi:hypothetical protein [Novispirillum itersonii]|uniref:hypothetical protein n=1 Tax=Novispirillum itersonii TaxID=189 RepID=UPI0003A580FD|nr:hypothetical protein [Novispirillum itersonii]